MTRQNHKEFIGWCIYCKEEIYSGDGHVIDKNDNILHLDCYNSIYQVDTEILETGYGN